MIMKRQPDINEITKYRPISQLQIITNIVESSIARQLHSVFTCIQILLPRIAYSQLYNIECNTSIYIPNRFVTS